MGLAGLFRRPRFERAGVELYSTAVAAARQPRFYAEWGVPDTVPGRFEMVCLHNGLLIHRINREGSPKGGKDARDLAQSCFDAMFADMDVNLREMGISDLRVGNRVKMLWEGFHGRAQAYIEAIEAGDDAALAAALMRNVWVKELAPDGAPEALARHARAVEATLAPQSFAALAEGKVVFP
jgi:cytochrome b pre-mRNA-processing protein 3